MRPASFTGAFQVAATLSAVILASGAVGCIVESRPAVTSASTPPASASGAPMMQLVIFAAASTWQ